MTDLRILTARLIASPGPSKLISDDGLALSYYPGSPSDASRVIAGRLGRYPARIEELPIMATIRRCTGSEVTYHVRPDHPGGYCLVEFRWQSNTAETPAPAAAGVTVYQVIRWSKDGLPYSAGVSTSRAEAEAMSSRTSGRRMIIESQIYPRPEPIRYGMKPRRIL